MNTRKHVFVASEFKKVMWKKLFKAMGRLLCYPKFKKYHTRSFMPRSSLLSEKEENKEELLHLINHYEDDFLLGDAWVRIKVSGSLLSRPPKPPALRN